MSYSPKNFFRLIASTGRGHLHKIWLTASTHCSWKNPNLFFVDSYWILSWWCQYQSSIQYPPYLRLFILLLYHQNCLGIKWYHKVSVLLSTITKLRSFRLTSNEVEVFNIFVGFYIIRLFDIFLLATKSFIFSCLFGTNSGRNQNRFVFSIIALLSANWN